MPGLSVSPSIGVPLNPPHQRLLDHGHKPVDLAKLLSHARKFSLWHSNQQRLEETLQITDEDQKERKKKNRTQSYSVGGKAPPSGRAQSTELPRGRVRLRPASAHHSSGMSSRRARLRTICCMPPMPPRSSRGSSTPSPPRVTSAYDGRGAKPSIRTEASR
ncbi:hypothetical protein VTK73DRAFT_4271 [Phialemonium thermophilum]|uniref:Uncharacterized protein n=1 Tax=Phialemonium thermophilum TaxID=223376 RepID=A0ABR3VA01_9PEZI